MGNRIVLKYRENKLLKCISVVLHVPMKYKTNNLKND